MRGGSLAASAIGAAVLAALALAAPAPAAPSPGMPAFGRGGTPPSLARAPGDRPPGGQARAPLVLVDDRGRELKLARAPQRIVSLAPHATELLFAAGLGERVVAVDPDSDHPAAARALPKVGALPQPSIERLLAMSPDLVVIWAPGFRPGFDERLAAFGVPVFVSDPRTLDAVADTLARFARIDDGAEAAAAGASGASGAVGPPRSGAEAAARFAGRLASLRGKWSQRAPVRVFVQIWGDPLITISDRDVIGDAIRACGGVNVAGSLPGAAPRVDIETVVAARPELVVATDSADSERRWRATGLLAPEGPARFAHLDATALQRPGPRVLDAVERLCEQIDAARAPRSEPHRERRRAAVDEAPQSVVRASSPTDRSALRSPQVSNPGANGMPVVAVVNPKGGVGKTTLATNLAGYFASAGKRTMLGDFDRQQSAAQWLKLRPRGVPDIETWQLNGSIARPPKGVTHVVLDTPAQIDDRRLADVVRVADRILVPLQPSMFDVLATGAFLETLRAAFGSENRYRQTVAIVGMRVDPRTRAAEQLGRFVETLGLPVAGALRDTQNYVQLAAHGLTLFDVSSPRVEKDRATWETLLGWVERPSGR